MYAPAAPRMGMYIADKVQYAKRMASHPQPYVVTLKPHSPRRWMRGLLAMTMAMDLSVGISLLAVPLLAIALDASPLLLGLLGVAWRVPYAIACPVAGTLSDRVGRKTLVLVASIALAVIYIGLAQATSLVQLAGWVVALGVATGMFWPPLQSWVGDVRGPVPLGAAVGRFNIAWSSASMIGTFSAGALAQWDPSVPFVVAAVAALFIATVAAFIPGRASCEQPKDPSNDEARWHPGEAVHRRFLTAAWVANAVAFYAVGTVTTFFPKLGDNLSLSPAVIGLVVGMAPLGRTISFVALSKGRWWQYHSLALWAALALGAAGTAVASQANDPAIFGAAFLAVGAAAAGTYTSSLFYSLDALRRTGTFAGVHESLLTAGMASGALLGGIAAEAYGLHTPFLLAAVLLVAAGLWVARSLPRGLGRHSELSPRRAADR